MSNFFGTEPLGPLLGDLGRTLAGDLGKALANAIPRAGIVGAGCGGIAAAGFAIWEAGDTAKKTHAIGYTVLACACFCATGFFLSTLVATPIAIAVAVSACALTIGAVAIRMLLSSQAEKAKPFSEHTSMKV